MSVADVKNADSEFRRNEYHRTVVEWSEVTCPSEPSLLVPLDLAAPEYTKMKIAARYCENISSHVKAFRLDQNHDGKLTPNEVAERQEEAKACVDGYLNLLVNFGVVGALFISVLFGFVVNDLTLSEESINFFGVTTTKVWKYMFLICANGAAVESLYLIFRSVSLYKHLSFWMPDIVAQMDWVETISITSTVVLAQIVLFLVLLAIPFGAAAAISPIAGLISTIWVIVILISMRLTSMDEERSEILLQRHTRRIFAESAASATTAK
jgi:hypothetical protein